jgi:murein DD-endopeptidase MepM/ murein hydrolase activator NlpD
VPRAAPYQWPVKPFRQVHPVRGYFNDPRISGQTRAFHFGIDISAADGTAVYAVASGTVHVEGGRSLSVVADDGSRTFGYWHVVRSVEHHQHVAEGQLLGRVEAGWAHVHFAESEGGEYHNPLRRGALTPWNDATTPRIVRIDFSSDGRVIPPTGLAGPVDLIAEAWDAPPKPPPAPWDGAVVTPAVIRWRVLRGATVVRPWHTPIDFTKTLLPPDRFDDVYAPGTRQNRPNKPGRYRFFLAHTWSTRLLPDGAYRVQVEASDTRGNKAVASQPFTIANGV